MNTTQQPTQGDIVTTKDGEHLGHVEIENGKIVTNGFIGENTYNNFVELIYGLQGHGIAIDNFYF